MAVKNLTTTVRKTRWGIRTAEIKSLTCHGMISSAVHAEQQKQGRPMMKQHKFRQASLILIATAIILILPNLTRLIS